MKITRFRCKKCRHISTSGQWNAKTLAHVTEQKKGQLLKKIQDAPDSLNYVCPVCGEISIKRNISPVANKLREVAV